MRRQRGRGEKRPPAMSARAFESPMAEQHLAAMKKFLGEYSETMIDLEESMADRVSLVWDPSNSRLWHEGHQDQHIDTALICPLVCFKSD